MPTKNMFKRPYKIFFSESSNYVYAHDWYTNGSLMAGKSGAGVNEPEKS